MTRSESFAEHARRYSTLGWALIRADGKKAKGAEWQKTAPTDPEYTAGHWAHWGATLNMGTVLGPSGLAVFEYDKPEARDSFIELLGGRLPRTPACKTGSGRGHVYFSNTSGVTASSRDGLELRAGGPALPRAAFRPPGHG